LARRVRRDVRPLSERLALIDGERTFTYADINRLSTNCALNLLELGLKTARSRRRSAGPTWRNSLSCTLRCRRSVPIPIAALVTHRLPRFSQFAELSGATDGGDAGFVRAISTIRRWSHASQAVTPALKHAIVLGEAPAGSASLVDLIERARYGSRPRTSNRS